MGVSSENLYAFDSASKYMAAIVLPSIAQPLALMPPWLMDFDLSGRMSIGSIFIKTPRPVHFLHAPEGLLKENICGVSSSMLIPCSGQA